MLKIESMNGLPVSFLSKVKDARSLIDAKRKADKAKDVGSTLKGLLGS
ncbi:MAG: hypothetical protein JKX85_09645 [Phycisphaeraceae bacterium]|nr:hypothetical protein [Phycisphaeraceae bacterium]